MRRILILFAFVMISSWTAQAAQDDLLGVWFNQEKDAKIEI